MLGAIIGDIVGSKFEFNNYRSKDFDLFTEDCFFTDDTVMTLAIAKALQESNPDGSDLEENTVKYMQEIGRHYPDCGYGGRFYGWMFSDDPKPYNSFGNGAAMRVSACVDTIRGPGKDEIELLLKRVRCITGVTHNHPEGFKGAEAVVLAAFFARIGKSIDEIKTYMDDHYYKVDFTLDEIRSTYQFNEACQGTVPQALAAFYESTDFEDAIRNAISIGGDSDTLAAITGTIAEEYYGIPVRLQMTALSFLDDRLLDLYEGYQEALGMKYMDPATLEDGKVLYALKRIFLEDQKLEKLDPLLSCLRDSIVKVPGTVGRESLDNASRVMDFFKQFGTRVTFSRMIGKYGISLQEYRNFLADAEKEIRVRRGGKDCTMYGGQCGAGINNYFFANGKVYYCGNCIDLPPIGQSNTPFEELERNSLVFDRNFCYKESLCV